MRATGSCGVVLGVMGWVGLAACGGADAAGPDVTGGDALVTTEVVGADAAADVALVGPGAEALMALMRSRDGARYQAALDAGVTFHATPDGVTFYAYWAPAGFDPASDGFIVSVPGHDTFASSAIMVWKDLAAARGYGLIALQWWLGSGETTADYLAPAAMMPAITQALAARGVPRGRVLLEGFSRGATNTYALTALDQFSGAPAFLMTLAASGGMNADYPPNQALEAGAYGDDPLAGTHWVLFCGGQDPDVEHSGCPAMQATATWLEGKQAVVDRFIQDPSAGHGGLNLVPANAEAALDTYQSRLDATR